MLTQLGLVCLLAYLAARLPVWLSYLPAWRRVDNWLWYRRASACPHDTIATAVLPAGIVGSGEAYLMTCDTCGVPLLQYTEADVRREIAKDQRRTERWARLRSVLVRWGIPLYHEIRLIATTIGSLVLVLALLLWWTWGTSGPPVQAAVRDICTSVR